MILTYSGKTYSISLDGKILNLQKILISFGNSIRHYERAKPELGGPQACEKQFINKILPSYFFITFVKFNLESS